jgi:hypothetical protein
MASDLQTDRFTVGSSPKRYVCEPVVSPPSGTFELQAQQLVGVGQPHAKTEKEPDRFFPPWALTIHY